MMESKRNHLTVFFIGVMCLMQAMAQVCPYSDPRCTCYSASLTCYNLDKIPPLNTGLNVSQIRDLLFMYGNITRISNNSLPPGLSTIYLFRHPLTNISEDAFDSSAATLLRVSVFGAQFTDIPKALQKLTKLTGLLLQDTLVQVWDSATLGQLAASLRSLELINVGLSAWPSWISDCHLLYSIKLSRNSLRSIPNDAFNFVEDKLTYLDLSMTGLTQVPQALSSLSRLETLYLSYNNLTDASQIDTITGAPFASKLSYLYLNSAGLTRAANFSNLTILRTLSLSNNKISDIPAGSLPTSLTMFYFSDNSLSNVPKDVASMYGLITLELTNNFITNIESNSFPSSLKYIFLDRNNLTIITNTTFRNLGVLSTLILSSNPISVIAPEAFSDLVSIQSLRLLDSHLTEVPLAFTLLNPWTDIYWSTAQPLSCPCPTLKKLVQWYTSRTNAGDIEATCSNNQSIDAYLRGQCLQTSATP